MICGVFFDMDGVLADTELLHFISAQQIVKEKGFRLPDNKFSEYIGISEEDMWKKIVYEFSLSVKFVDFEKQRRINFKKLIDKKLIPNKGLMELLLDLRSHNIKIVLVSSSSKEIVDLILNKLNITSYFEVIVSGDDVKRKKPHTEPYKKALELTSLKSNEAIAVEDSIFGILSAKNTGIYTIGLKTYHTEKELRKADKIINTLEELNYNILSNLI